MGSKFKKQIREHHVYGVLCRRPDIIKEATDFYKDLYACKETSTYEYKTCDDDIRDTAVPHNILRSEIEWAIRTQKNDKAPGDDKISNELLKSFSEALEIPLQMLFDNIISEGQVPDQWLKSTITLLHKKGDKDDLNNYRPISLMSNMYKIFSKIILNRLTKILDENQPREQAGFRKYFSTIDHIHVISQIVEKCKEYGKILYICFIDFTKAFDSIMHKAICHSLLQQGVDQKYVNLLFNIYTKSSAKVRLERNGWEFPIEKGVRQGDPLSPKIFSAVLESVFRKLNWRSKGLNIDGEYLSHLRFADDIVVFAEDPDTLQVMLEELTKECLDVGLTLNTSKTKIITNGNVCNVEIEGQGIECVNEYIYLGQAISFEDRTENEINRRIALAWKKFWGLKEVMKNQQVNMRIKRKVFDTAILPCLTYGCQTWSLRKQDEERLEICQRKMERSTIGIKLSYRVKNTEIKLKTKFSNVSKKIRSLKWKWAGHICRLENNRWAKRVTEWIPRENKRSRGRPRMRWKDVFVQRVGPHWMRTARDRGSWKELGEAYAREATTAK